MKFGNFEIKQQNIESNEINTKLDQQSERLDFIHIRESDISTKTIPEQIKFTLDTIDKHISTNIEKYTDFIKQYGAEKMPLNDIKGYLIMPGVAAMNGIVYFETCKALLLMRSIDSSLENISRLVDNPKDFLIDILKFDFVKEIRTFVEENIDLFKEIFGETPITEIAEYAAGIIFDAIQSLSYLTKELAVGVLLCVEDIAKFIAGSVTMLAGYKEISQRIYEMRLAEMLGEWVEQNFDAPEYVKKIGKSAEKIGEIGTYIALGILAAGGIGGATIPAVVSVISEIALGTASAGAATRNAIERTGEFTYKEFLYGVGTGLITVLPTHLTTVITPEIDKLGDAIRGMIKNKEQLKWLVDVTTRAFKGLTTSETYAIPQQALKALQTALGWNVDNEASINELIKAGLVGAAAGIVAQGYSDIKDIHKLGLEKAKIKKYTHWSDEVVTKIDSMEQYEKVYKNAGLHETTINGRPALVKDIDMNYVDAKTGMTNRELMEKGRSPIDAKTGEKIELHHIGQNHDSPLAELCENSEHGDGNHKILHPKADNSWRKVDPQYDNQYKNVEKPNHWKTRAKEI